MGNEGVHVYFTLTDISDTSMLMFITLFGYISIIVKLKTSLMLHGEKHKKNRPQPNGTICKVDRTCTDLDISEVSRSISVRSAAHKSSVIKLYRKSVIADHIKINPDKIIT